MSPAKLPVRSNCGHSASARSAAAPSGRPAANACRKAAPPGNRRRTSTSRCGRATSASSPRQSSIGASVNAPEFIAQIVTIGCDERTISTDGCSLKRIMLIALESSIANAVASSGATSAA